MFENVDPAELRLLSPLFSELAEDFLRQKTDMIEKVTEF